MGFGVVSSLDAKNLHTRFGVMLVSDLLVGSWDLVLKVKSSSPTSKPLLCLTCVPPTQIDIKSLNIELVNWFSLFIYLVQCWRPSQLPCVWSERTLSLSPQSRSWFLSYLSWVFAVLGLVQRHTLIQIPFFGAFAASPLSYHTSLRLFCVSIIIWVSL